VIDTGCNWMYLDAITFWIINVKFQEKNLVAILQLINWKNI
jgi:hypothetical protein